MRIPPTGILSIVYKLQSGIIGALTRLILTRSKAVWEIWRENETKRRRRERDRAVQSLNPVCCLSREPFWTRLYWEELCVSLGSLLCWFLPTYTMLHSFSFFFFTPQFLFVIQTVMHKTWRFEVPRVVCITGEKPSIQNSYPYLVYCLLRVCSTRIKNIPNARILKLHHRCDVRVV